MYEKKITVKKYQNSYWYTAEVRRFYFLLRGRWKEIIPVEQPTFEDAERQLNNFL